MGKRGGANDDANEQFGDERLARIKRRCGHCGLCKAVMRDLVGHCSRRPQCKHHPDTRPLTEEEMAALINDFNEQVANPEYAKAKRVELAKAKHQQEWQPPSGAPVSEGPYRLQFRNMR